MVPATLSFLNENYLSENFCEFQVYKSHFQNPALLVNVALHKGTHRSLQTTGCWLPFPYLARRYVDPVEVRLIPLLSLCQRCALWFLSNYISCSRLNPAFHHILLSFDWTLFSWQTILKQIHFLNVEVWQPGTNSVLMLFFFARNILGLFHFKRYIMKVKISQSGIKRDNSLCKRILSLLITLNDMFNL